MREIFPKRSFNGGEKLRRNPRPVTPGRSELCTTLLITKCSGILCIYLSVYRSLHRYRGSLTPDGGGTARARSRKPSTQREARVMALNLVI